MQQNETYSTEYEKKQVADSARTEGGCWVSAYRVEEGGRQVADYCTGQETAGTVAFITYR